MAKFCGNCGAQLDEGARVCGFCGTPVEGVDTVEKVRSIPGIKNESHQRMVNKTKIKKVAKRALIVVIIAVILVAGGYVAYSYTGYRGAANKVMRAYKNYDIDTLTAMSSSLYDGDATSFQFINNIKDPISADFDTFDGRLGYNYNITYKISNAYKLSNRQLEQTFSVLNYSFNGDVEDVISSIEVVVVDITATSKQKPINITRELYFSKEGNEWLLLGIEG